MFANMARNEESFDASLDRFCAGDLTSLVRRSIPRGSDYRKGLTREVLRNKKKLIDFCVSLPRGSTARDSIELNARSLLKSVLYEKERSILRLREQTSHSVKVEPAAYDPDTFMDLPDEGEVSMVEVFFSWGLR